jgi:hypothetical protein
MSEMFLRDSDIRGPLHRWLLDQHANDAETSVIHELKLPRPTARVDIAVVNGDLAAFEIKSDVDSLARLPRQILSFNKVFDRICVVTTKRHAQAVQRTIPHWWGISIAKNQNGEVRFKNLRRGRQNPHPDLMALLHALYLPELRSILRCHDITAFSSCSKNELIQQVLGLPMGSTRTASRDALRQRLHGNNQSSPLGQLAC